jgi:type IV pilus assembly protein PilX
MKIVKQQGSALIVSLIMLTSVTFLAILSLQGSTTQIRIVSNLQIKEDMFHTSKRELGYQYDGFRNQLAKVQEMSDAMSSAVNTTEDGVSAPEAQAIDSMLDTSVGGYIQSSTLRYTQTVPVNLNHSLDGIGSSVGAIATMPFEIVSATTDSSGRFRSNQKLGFKYFVPASGR